MRNTSVYKILKRLIDAPLPSVVANKIHLWLRESRANDEKDKALYQIWIDTKATPDSSTYASLVATKQKIGLPLIQHNKTSTISAYLRYAAILILPLITGLSVWFIAKERYTNVELIECYVPNGKQQQLTLPDGSLIHLNSGTTIIYSQDFSIKNRTVYLSGEAFFSVAKDQSKPFIVHSGGIDIQVLGTKFNVNAYPSNRYITTTLELGSVKVYKKNLDEKAITLKPNDQLIYSKDNDQFTLEKINSTDYTSWTHGEVRFINQPLSDILNEMERRYDVKFKISTDIKSTDLYTMKFKKHETIEDAMRVFTQLAGNINCRISDHEVLLYAKRKGGGSR